MSTFFHMSRRTLRFLVVACLMALTMPAAAQFGGFGDTVDDAGPEDSSKRVKVSAALSKQFVRPGDDFVVAVILDHDPGWHTWTVDGRVPGGDDDLYIRTAIDASVTAGDVTVHAGFIQLPERHDFTFFDDPSHVYEGRAIAYFPATVPADANPGEATIRIRAGFQACDDRGCLFPLPTPPRPTDKDQVRETAQAEWDASGFDITVEVVEATDTRTNPDLDDGVFDGFDATVIQKIRAGEKPPEVVEFDLFGWQFSIDVNGPGGLILLLLVAAFGGFLLNMTPCVLPVIPIKIMGLSQSAGNRGKLLVLGITMCLGVIAFWMALGIAIAALAGFTATNQLFQYPAFTITVGVIIAAMAVGMCGLFAVRLPQAVYRFNPSHESLHGSFGFGLMTAVLSTPCTAPFMGAAAAWAATQSPVVVLSVFASIGGGMALPYFILSAFPKLVEKMPRTGPASELIKQVMGLLMLAAAAYFIGVGLSGALVSPPDPPSRLYWWAVAALVAAAGGLLIWRTWRITPSLPKRASFGGLGVVILAIAVIGGMRFTDKGPIDWIYYTPDRFEQAKGDGTVVVMEFTAEWCLNCKTLEETVLRTDSVVAALMAEGVTPIKVDLTGNNTDGNAMLKAVDRVTIPLLVIFKSDGTEAFKGDYYTPEQVLNAVAEARGEAVARR